MSKKHFHWKNQPDPDPDPPPIDPDDSIGFPPPSDPTPPEPPPPDPEPEPPPEPEPDLEPEPDDVAVGVTAQDGVEQFTYTPPTITASGTTFAQLRAGGASGHLERLIAAQSPPLSGRMLSLCRAPKSGNLQFVYNQVRTVLEEFIDVKANLVQLQTVMAMLNTLCTEAGVLIDANPGTLGRTVNGVGNAVARRTWP
jgi:hypothetical protein